MKKIYFLVLAFCFFNGLNAQVIDFPDVKFKEHLLSSTYGGTAYDKDYNQVKIDANNDGNIEMSEVSKVTRLAFNSSQFLSMEGISNFKNLEFLTITEGKITKIDLADLPNLKNLEITKNSELLSVNLNGLTSLEVLSFSMNQNFDSFNYRDLTNLKVFACNYCKVSSLDLTKLLNIEEIGCEENQLKSIQVSNLPKLKKLWLNNNQIENIDLSGLVSLENLSIFKNLIRTLDLHDLSNLQTFSCWENKIESLDLSKQRNLSLLLCRSNQLLTLDISLNIKLNYVDCRDNNITSLFCNNGLEMGYSVQLDNNPNLKYVCIGEGKRKFDIFMNNAIYSAKNIGDISKLVVNSYCSFVHGGDSYEVKGNTKLDYNKDGCDLYDLEYPNLQLRLTSNKNVVENFIANTFGNYSISLVSGDYSLSPVIENPNYFSVFPNIITVSFPSIVTPIIQNFCVTPNGVHSDLEISLLPIDVSRPGFDAKYKIVYKNKGNVKQSGSINLKFDDTRLDYVSSSTAFSNKTSGNLEWNFTNLQPFESKEIIFTMNVNSPMETPAVNNGDILKFVATIASQDTDETPIDNTFTLNQTVVGSYDPNDKTCLEGDIITPNLIGEYVHYMIRFENTGTYAAQNIVVKDMIDLSKFDISTLIPTSSSHSFVTKISEGNKVEFIFENINLPFDDANNDGYVAFKIKTKPTLKVGDSFTNEANIYFDYNFPILTNKATSKFQNTLANPDFEFSNYFALYPNPANDVLNINAVQAIEIQSLAIYDVLGQLVIAVPNAKSVSNIDVSKLRTGTYFIKVKSDKGSSSMKFIKK